MTCHCEINGKFYQDCESCPHLRDCMAELDEGDDVDNISTLPPYTQSYYVSRYAPNLALADAIIERLTDTQDVKNYISMRLKFMYMVRELIIEIRKHDIPANKYKNISHSIAELREFWMEKVFPKTFDYSERSEFYHLVANTTPAEDRLILGYAIVHAKAWASMMSEFVLDKFNDASKSYHERNEEIKKHLNFFTTWYETTEYD